jgi:hypothetical protein
VLKAHLDASEAHLLEIARIPANAGHTLHKGTPREAFIKEFLEEHLAETIAVGTGEVIDASSKPGERRNQLDVVLYKRSFPKLAFGGGIHGFFAESVVSTISVKSVLTEEGFKESVDTAHKLKGLKKNLVTSFHTGYQPPSILSFLVAYDGPASMKTVHGWITRVHSELGITIPDLPQTQGARVTIAGPSIDGVFVLGRGFLYFDNAPIGFIHDDRRAQWPDRKWVYVDTDRGSLLLLFLILTAAVSGVSASWLDPFPYLTGFTLDEIAFES